MWFSLLLMSLSLPFTFGAPAADNITDLPDANYTINFQQYSGYLTVNNIHHLHYWFVESQGNPSKDPLVLWLNGGPGCSSLDGLLYEHGPFHVDEQGNLYKNDYAWNLVSNVIYLESPIGVGFSYSDDGNYSMNDNSTADDNYHALLAFFSKFPEYVGRDFYVIGESYAGVYVPSLTLRILQGNANNEGTQINIKGFAVGNGLSSYQDNDDSSVWFAYHHGLVSEDLWNNLTLHCCVAPYTRQTCNFYDSTNSQCEADVGIVMDVIYNSKLNWYNIYGDCETTTQISHKKYIQSMKLLFRKYHEKNNYKYIKNLEENVPCIDTTGADIYLNRVDVRNAIHISSNFIGQWSICSDILNYTTIYDDMTPIYNEIYKLDSNIHTTIYNGDVDLSCNFLGDQWVIDDMGLTSISNWREWTLDNDNQVAGWTKDWDRISFVTVRGAGHMVPQWRPQQALKLFQYFLNNQRL